VLLCVLCVKSFSCLKEIKGLTQRTQRREEKTGDGWAGFGILDETIPLGDLPLRLVLRRRAWYIEKAKYGEDGNSWLTQLR
jgi:hypothetical protein